ncbi:MAG: lipase family alpha/beta hydrolase [Stenotrophobium sp.]
MTRRAVGLVWIVLIAAIVACGSADSARPDLRRLYEFSNAAGPQPPVIVVPGILGSRLRERASHREIWPGSLWNLLFGNHARLALRIDPKTLEPIDDGVEASGLFEGVLGRDFYGQIIRTLEQYGGYAQGLPGQRQDGRQRRYYVFAYDWRQDNVVSARKLDALIEQIRRDYGDPRLKVDVIAHSMGGLIVRYFLRYGTADVLDGDDFPVNLDGAAKLHTVVLLGTPNLGSVSSLHGFLEGTRVGLRRITTEVLATMPSMYELFPHPIYNWLVTPDGKPLDLDLFNVEVWQGYGWSVFDAEVVRHIRENSADVKTADAGLAVLQRYFAKRLERARRFVWSLTVPLPQTPVKLVVFGGDCTLTPARLLVEDEHGDSVARLYPDEVRHRVPGVDYTRLMLEPGDGEVTKSSLLARQSLDPTVPRNQYLFFPLAYAFFLCEQHDQLTGNINFQDNLLNILLAREHPWDHAARMPARSDQH